MCVAQVAEQDKLDAQAAACSAERMLAVLESGSPGCRARTPLGLVCFARPSVLWDLVLRNPASWVGLIRNDLHHNLSSARSTGFAESGLQVLWRRLMHNVMNVILLRITKDLHLW